MISKRTVPVVLAATFLVIAVFGTLPAHAATTVWTVSLDANSISNVDANPQTTGSFAKTFSVGAIVNASGTAGACGTSCLTGVFGWQFSIVYDKTSFVPQADPVALAVNDASGNTANFGAQAGTQNPNWAGQAASSHAFGSQVILPVDATHNKIEIFFTLLGVPSVSIFPTITTTVKGNLLANVAFELVNKPASPVQFSITDVSFVDSSANPLPNIIGGSPITETITNNPPIASFSVTHLASGDISCAAITTANCSDFAIQVDGSASSDIEAPIVSPGGYFWDWGDTTQDNINSVATCALSNCNQGVTAIHDYGGAGIFNVTLRVVDGSGATGSARDALGGVIVNNQPSHALQTITLVQSLPLVASVDCGTGQTVGKPFNCTVSATGGTGPYTGTGTFSVTQPNKGTFTESFLVTDSASGSATGQTTVIVAPQPLVVTVTCPSSEVTVGKPFECTVTASGGTGPYSGTGSFSRTESSKGTKTESFTVTDANVVSASSSATVNVTAQPLVVTTSCPTSGLTSGKPFDCTVSATGGTSPYTGTGTVSRTEAVKGTFTESFTVTDANSVSAIGTASVTIGGQPLVVSVSCPTSGLTAGKPFTCDVSAVGGTTPYTGVGPHIVTEPTKGTFVESFTVTDGNSVSASASQSVTIVPQPLVVTVTCSSTGVTAGKPFDCTVEAVGGTAPYQGTGVFSRTEDLKGSKTESFTVIDANTVGAVGSATVLVSPQPLVVTATCSSSGVTASKPFTCSVSATGGTGPYTGTGTISRTEAVKGSKTESFTVTDANAVSITVTANVDVAPQPLVVTVSCPASVNAGQAFDCTVSATEGTGPYQGTGSFSVTEPVKGSHTESFSVTDANSVTASGSATVAVSGTALVVTVTCPSSGVTAGKPFDCTVEASGDTGPYSGTGTFSVTEPTKGVKTESFSVTDANGVTASGSATVTVGGQPLVVTVTCPVSGITAGKPFNCTVSATGGTSPYSGTGLVSRTEQVKGTATESFTVTDANGATASASTTVDVTAQPLVVTASCPANATAGVAFTCDVSATGGTPPYSGTGSFTITEALKGSQTESFTVGDANGASASASATVNVAGTPLVVTVTCPATAMVGESFDCTVEASGDTGPYTGTGTFSRSESTKGSKIESFSVTDANGVTMSGSATISITGLPLVVTVTCPATAMVHVGFDCAVSATGGTEPYSGTGVRTDPSPEVKGIKTESFSVTDANGATATGSTTVNVLPQPLIGTFSVSANPTIGQPVTFTASASGGTTPYSFAWSFGDTGTATGNPATHTYTAAGNYTVLLTVTDANVGSTGASGQVIITAIPPPVASFTESASTTPTGTTITFDASGSTSSGTITSYAWNFGDGNTVTGVTTSHAYAVAGNYTVTLTVLDSNGLTASSTSVKVITDRPPTAAFTFTPTNPLAGQTVSFDASSSSDPDGSIVNYSWSFGDSTTGSGQTTSHVYTSSGMFNITLTVTDNNGKTGIASASVTVSPATVAGAHASLAKWSAQPDLHHQSIDKDPTNTLMAYGVNDGNRTVWVYVQFHIVSDTGSSTNLYTQRVQLAPSQAINGKTDSQFSAVFIPPGTGSFTVVATIYYSANAVAPPIGDASFHPDTASVRSFSFTVVP